MIIDFFYKSFITKRTMEEVISNSNEDHNNCIWVKDINGKYIFVNSKLCEAIGEERESMLSYNAKDYLNSKSFELINEDDSNVINLKKISIINERHYSNGKEFLLHTHKLPIINDDGSCTSLFAIARKVDYIEINSKKKLEDDKYTTSIVNYESKRHYNNIKDIYEAIKELYEYPNVEGVSVWMLSDELTLKNLKGVGCVEEVSGNYEIKITKEEQESFISKYEKEYKLLALKDDEDIHRRNNLDDVYDNYLKDRKKVCIAIIKDLTFLGVLNIYCNIPNYNKKIEKFFKSMADRIAVRIENINLSNKLKEQFSKKITEEKELKFFLNMATDLCLILDYKGNIKKVSSNAVEFTGWSSEELVKMNIRNIFDLTDKSISLKEILNNFNKKCYGGVFIAFCKDGSKKMMEIYYYNDKSKKCIYIMSKEVSVVVELQGKIKDLEQKISQEVFKTDFLANVSHEFRTPLNIIISTIQLLMLDEENKDNNKIYKYFNTLKQNSFRLLRLINNLIDLTKLDNNKIEPCKVNTNIVSTIEDIVDSLAGYIENINRSIVFDTDEEEVLLACDLDMIERVLLNLISNAIKFTTENGNIIVKISTDWEKKRVYVSVRDDGIGIEYKDRDIVFERFKQLDNTFTRRAEGSGIGLALIKSLIELHEGEIYLNTEIEKGTEFIFYLPIKIIEDRECKNIKGKVYQSKSEKYTIEFSDIYER